MNAGRYRFTLSLGPVGEVPQRAEQLGRQAGEDPSVGDFGRLELAR